MSGTQLIACLIIAVVIGLIASLDGDQRMGGGELGVKVGATVFIVGIIITALCG